MGPNQTYKLLQAKETISKKKKQHMDWEKIFANFISEYSLVSRMYKNNLPGLNSKKQTKKTQPKQNQPN